jgi:hypothetical protein
MVNHAGAKPRIEADSNVLLGDPYACISPG